MRVLHVSQPTEAGVPRVVLGLVADQRARGYDVHVACPAGPDLAAEARSLGATHHDWQAVREPGPSVAAEARSLRALVRRVAPDVVVLHSAKAGLAGRLTRLGPPVVYVPHAWSFEAVTGRTARAAAWWEIAAGRRTDAVVGVSADELERGRAIGIGAPMVVVPNGVDLDRHRPDDRDAARTRLGLADVPTVVCVGRLAEQKGQDKLLDLWPSVRAAVPDAELVLVGDGPLRDELAARHLDGVRLVGAQSDVRSWLAAADVVALPSRWESTPLVGLEAMAAGRPVVAFDVDGLTTAFGDTGRIHTQTDATGYAASLTSLLQDTEGAATAGKAARARVEEVGDLRRVVRAWDALLHSVIRGDRPTAGEATEPHSRRPLSALPVTDLTAQLVGGAFGDVDAAAVTGDHPLDRVRTAVLSAWGVPVRWASATPPGVPTLGAPVLTGSGPDVDARLAEHAGRVGAGTTVAGPPVSVVITVLNEGSALPRVRDDILGQLRDDDEFVIVDGGSTDGSVEGLAPDPRLTVIVSPGAGISQGRNIGIERARHEVIVCTDAGCEPYPGFVDAYRDAFAVADPPALVSGLYVATDRDPMERAQALACYPQPSEVARPSLLVRAYTRVFGTGFDARYAVGRCVGFTRTAWREVGGFPEHLATGEDVTFGLAVAEHGRAVAATDAVVDWHQRDGVAATWRMYRGYGRSSTDGGDPRLLVRDAARAAAYVVVPLLATTRPGRRLAVAGAAAYLSLPVARALRAGTADPATLASVPVAMAVKDLGKLAGALEGLQRKRSRRS